MTAERELRARARRVVQHPVGAHARLLDGGELELTRLGRAARRLGSGSSDRLAGDPAAVGRVLVARGCGCVRRRARCAPLEAAGVTVYLVGAGPGRPGAADRARARADRRRRRDRLRPADPAPARSTARGPDATLIVRRQGGRRARRCRRRRSSGCCVEHGARGADGGPAEGRRSVRVRARRRGGRGAARRRDRVRGRPGRHRRRRRRRRTPGIPVTHRDAASAVAFVTGHEDPAKPESALDWEALARVPGHARRLHGGRQLAGDRASG